MPATTTQTVILASYPRSGNTFFRMVLEECYGLKTWTKYQGEGKVLWKDREVTKVPDDYPVRFIKSHHRYTGSEPVVYVVRDGRDAIVSLSHYMEWVGLHGFIDNLRGYASGAQESWSAHVDHYLNRGDAIVVKFEDMLDDPVGTVADTVAKLDLDLTDPDPDAMPDFSELHEKNPEFFRRGEAGQWRDDMPDDIHSLFWQTHGHAMEALGYEY